MITANKKFGQLADEIAINKTVNALKEKGVSVWVVKNADKARKKFFTIIPQGAEIMNMTSVTFKQLGLDKEIEDSGKYNPIRKIFATMDSNKQKTEMKRLGAVQQWATGSIHALTEDGTAMIASGTGSQLPAYAYGADHLLWIIGTQKIVKDIKAGFDRIYQYCLPLENKRALKAYGTGSEVNKILILYKEVLPEKINIIIVKEKLGF